MVNVVTGVVSLLLIAAGLCYFLATMGTGLMEGRRHRRGSGGRPGADPRGLGGTATDGRSMAVYFLVPCLNEEAVIASTLTGLLAHPGGRVVVVDDASDDRTAKVVTAFAGRSVMLVSRMLPNARRGKGPALNAGLPAIAAHAAARGLDPDRVLVCVMDADGALSEGALGHVVPLFDDPQVGGVQLGVRIRNRSTNLLTTMQDFEFWGISATSQMGRIRLGTVSLGGNGQFTRLSALLGLGHAPWSSALTEDLDLSITLLLNGWRLTTTPGASVHQQGIESLRGLIRQRTRWFQGHMSCARRLGDLWRCRTLPNMAVLETSAYLLIPWLFVLPWSMLFHVAVWQTVQSIADLSAAGVGWQDRYSLGITLVFWYLLAFAPSVFAGYVYYRQDARVGRLRAAALGHVLVPFNYVAFVSAWLATVRILRGQTSWEKTSRRPEVAGEPLLIDAATLDLSAAMPPPPPTVPRAVPRPAATPRRVVKGTLVLDRPDTPRGYGSVVVDGRFRPPDVPTDGSSPGLEPPVSSRSA